LGGGEGKGGREGFPVKLQHYQKKERKNHCLTTDY